MPPARRARLIELLWQFHRWSYRVSGGRLGGRLIGMPVLLLTTTGRRTGKAHTTALMFLPEGRNFVIVASNGGAPHHPAWFLNLRARPQAEIQIRRRLLRVQAREAEGAERAQLWARIVQTYAGYAAYQARTSRRIPVIVLEQDRAGDQT